jgi:cephalosporin-C deacetylase-like acetyl esterase
MIYCRTLCISLLLFTVTLSRADESTDLADRLRKLDTNVLATDADKAKELARTLSVDTRRRLDEANQRETDAWRAIKTRAEWERYRDDRIKALRASLGTTPPIPSKIKTHVTGNLKGEGYEIDNIVYESRPGLWVTANMYRPATAGKKMPGILIIHSHHNPKTQGELQDMGVTWARQGCVVLVPDQIGHGERRQHPFVDEKSYPKAYRVSRQDYYFRYNLGIQLSLVGDSLIGWMAWDMMRGVDVLLARPGVDPKRIALLGSVAAGGDSAAVTAALDPRIAVVAPFNFGGPQPETRYPLPKDAERTMNFAGSGSWESTRNLPRSVADGFLPWVIVGAAAPRGLIYAHEFAWDREHDPVWTRLGKIYSFYEAADHLASCNGRGAVTGKPPEATHCNNIGPEHRKGIYPAFKKWLDLPIPEKDANDRHTARELACLAPEIVKEIKPRTLIELAAEKADERLTVVRRQLAEKALAERRRRLSTEWSKLLHPVQKESRDKFRSVAEENLGRIRLVRLSAEVERGVPIPALLLLPSGKRPPVVVGIAQEGKQRFLKERGRAIAELLRQNVAVCLVDVRGTGETRTGSGRGRQTSDTSLSATEQMLGGTLLGARLRDLRAVVKYLQKRDDIDGSRLALWGESFAPVNAADRDLAAPLDAPDLPEQSEPLGALLATFGALENDHVKAVVARGGLVSYRSLLDSPFCYVPHDAVVPGALTTGDLPDILAALAPRALRIEGAVDGLNRRVPGKRLTTSLEPVRKAYAGEKAEGRLFSTVEYDSEEKLAAWLVDALK